MAERHVRRPFTASVGVCVVCTIGWVHMEYCSRQLSTMCRGAATRYNLVGLAKPTSHYLPNLSEFRCRVAALMLPFAVKRWQEAS
jgi:hypothetical protein